MTAPAAALIQRPTLARGAAQPERPVGIAAQDGRETGGFAAHLEISTQPAGPEKAANLHPASALLGTTNVPDAALQAEPEVDAATGKVLPDKRQNLAEAATQTVLALLGAQITTDSGDAPFDAAKLESSPDAPTTPEGANPQLPVAIAALALPAPAAPPRTPTMVPAGTAARLGTLPKLVGARGASATAPTVTTPEVAPTATGPAATAQAALASPAVSFVLEPDGPVQDAPKPAAETQPAAAQAAARAEPSTLAALTGAPDTARTPGGKPRAEAETALPTSKAAPELTASALPQAQPLAAAANADPAAPASAQPAEGIGFDALVDSIARARDGAADGGPVAVAMRHAEFGRVSLRFQTDADGLSVAMTSADPAFAPAVAAAHAAEAAAAAAMTSDAAQRPAQGSTAASDAGGSSQTNTGQANTGQSNTGQSASGQRHEAPGQTRVSGNDPRSSRRGGEAPAGDTTTTTRGGIFA